MILYSISLTWFCCTDTILLYALLLWNLISPAMRIRSFRSGAKQGLFSVGGIFLTFSFLMSLFMHVAIVVAIGYHSVYLTTAPLLLASSVIFLVKSCVDKQFRTWRLGPKLTHCLIAGIFPVTTPRPESKMENKQENTRSLATAKVKMAGGELFFGYLLHLAVLVLGLIAFTLLSANPEYDEKMRKLEEVSTISMATMVYTACPLALLLSMASHCDPWRTIWIRSGCCPGSCSDCKPLSRSEIVQTAEEVEETDAVDL